MTERCVSRVIAKEDTMLHMTNSTTKAFISTIPRIIFDVGWGPISETSCRVELANESSSSGQGWR